MSDALPTVHSRRSISLFAFAFVLIGFVVATLCWFNPRWPQAISWAALGIEIVAFVLGMRAWRHSFAKVAIAGSVVFIALTLVVTFRGPTVQRRIRPTTDWMLPLESTWELQSPGKAYSILTSSDWQKNGEDSLRFEIRDGEQWVDAAFETTYRSEIATREYAAMDSTKWYSFSVYFPEDFPIEENRLVFAQWHQPINLGEPGISPPLSFHFENGKLKIKLRHTDELSVHNPDKVPDERLFSGGLHSGRWYDFVVQAKWSWQQDGFVNIWLNKKQIVEYRGPVGYRKKTGPQFKFGLYRDATEKTYVVYFNQVKSGDTPQEVDFDPAAAAQYTQGEEKEK